MVREMGMMQVTPVADRTMRAKARELMEAASVAAESEAALAALSAGFAELSALADARRRIRVACVSKALSAIFKRMPEGNPEDLPFIVHIAMNFLDSMLAPDAGPARGVDGVYEGEEYLP